MSLKTAALMFVVTVSVSTVHAQDFPGLGVGDIAAMNAQFDAQFDVWARQGAWEVAQQLPNDVSSGEIISAMRPFTVENTWGSYNNAWWGNQQRTTDAIEAWDTGAIRGEANFYDSEGYYYQLPYDAGGYHYGTDGYLYEGHGDVDYGQNLYYEE